MLFRSQDYGTINIAKDAEHIVDNFGLLENEIDAKIINKGTINIEKEIQNYGELINEENATLIVNQDLINNNTSSNTGKIMNRGNITIQDQFTNDGDMINESTGKITITDAYFNNGYLLNKGTIDIEQYKTFDNQGAVSSSSIIYGEIIGTKVDPIVVFPTTDGIIYETEKSLKDISLLNEVGDGTYQWESESINPTVNIDQ